MVLELYLLMPIQTHLNETSDPARGTHRVVVWQGADCGDDLPNESCSCLKGEAGDWRGAVVMVVVWFVGMCR